MQHILKVFKNLVRLMCLSEVLQDVKINVE